MYQVAVGDLAGTWLSRLRLGPRAPRPGRRRTRPILADQARFAEVNRRFRGLYPDGLLGRSSWLRLRRSPEGRQALEAWRRNRRLLSLTRAKDKAVGTLLDAASWLAGARVYGRQRCCLCHRDGDTSVMPMTCDISRGGARSGARCLPTRRAAHRWSVRACSTKVSTCPTPTSRSSSVERSGEREHVQRVGRLLAARSRQACHGLRARDDGNERGA